MEDNIFRNIAIVLAIACAYLAVVRTKITISSDPDKYYGSSFGQYIPNLTREPLDTIFRPNTPGEDIADAFSDALCREGVAPLAAYEPVASDFGLEPVTTPVTLTDDLAEIFPPHGSLRA